MEMQSLLEAFRTHARTKLDEHAAQIARCAALLTEAELWQRDNAHTNSVGNLVLHLTGNIRQWILGGFGGQIVVRDRPAEFAERGPRPKAEIMAGLDQVIGQANEVLAALSAEAMAAGRNIQGYDVTGLVAISHVIEHLAFHTGQIVHITKCLRDVDLSLYDAHGHKRPGCGHAP